MTPLGFRSKRRPPPDPRYPWRYRRLCVFWCIALCSAGLIYLTLHGADTRLNGDLAQIFGMLLGSTIGAYVFGAVWHDRGLMAQAAEAGQSPFPEDGTQPPPPCAADGN